MRKPIVALLATLFLLVPLLAACGSQPAAQPTTAPDCEHATAGDAGPPTTRASRTDHGATSSSRPSPLCRGA